MEHLTAKLSCFARAYHYENHAAHVFADGAARRAITARISAQEDSAHA